MNYADQFTGDRSSPFSTQEMAAIEDVLQEVYLERQRQQAKWGRQDHPDGTGPWVRPLEDEDNEVYSGMEASALAEIFTNNTDQRFKYGSGTYRDILLEEVFEAMAESDPNKLRAELVQTAAVAVAWIEKIDREGSK